MAPVCFYIINSMFV